ncbi:MAG: LapA family protein [Gammaproteobacteria bacterium]|nr:LapA family protein [Gammaproteobacteria bacterium]
MRRLFYLLIIIVVGLLGATFAIENQAQTVEVQYYFGFSKTLPLSVLVYIVLAIGIILGVLLTSTWVLRVKLKLGKAKRHITKLEANATISDDR